jgi:hypothetical protein
MGNVIYTTPTRLEDGTFAWMVGRYVGDVRFAEPSPWWIDFAGGGSIATHGSVWRLMNSDSIVACSCDHGHTFGLQAPVDVGELARVAIGDARIERACIGERAPDLRLHFANGLVLEVLALSRGYESWETCDPDGRCFVVRGSRNVSTWQDRD